MITYPAPTAADLLVITDQVWTSFLDPEGVAPLLPVLERGGPEDVTASVSVTGAWRGHVVVTFSAKAAQYAAAALLGVDFDEVTLADITDGVGEIANIIGGNVKSLVPEPSALSLPHVLTGSAGQVHWPSVREVCHISGTWLGEPVTVSVLESAIDHRIGPPA